MFFCKFATIIRISKTTMSKMKIVVLDGYTANPGDLSWEGLELLGEVTVYDRTKPNETVARAAEAEIVITNKVVIGREEMAQLPHLIYIGVLATGYNVVDIAAARDRGIIVTNVPAYSTESVAQMVFAHLLTVTNHTERYAIENRQGRWSSNPDFCYYANSITELADKTFGIVGLGNIGQRVAQIAQAFGMKVKAFTSKPAEALPEGIQKADLKELFQTSDIISLHCPLTPDTHHLIKAETIAWMNPETILINTGRGPLVDDAALAEALKAGRLKAYCADVMTEEPPKADNPLLQVDNAYITPHIAWATKEARQRLLQIATTNVSAFLKGTPQNVIG
jgi:glycerate dehydrogenase